LENQVKSILMPKATTRKKKMMAKTKKVNKVKKVKKVKKVNKRMIQK